MKATIHGVAVEGTPEEIVRYEQLRNLEFNVTTHTVTVDGKEVVKKMFDNLKKLEGVKASY